MMIGGVHNVIANYIRGNLLGVVIITIVWKRIVIIKNGRIKMEVGETRTIKQRKNRKECEFCEEPATYKLTFLLPNARGNPASSAYGKDDCSWCSDKAVFVCDEHGKDNRKIGNDLGMGWCSSFAYERFKHMFEYWEEVEEDCPVCHGQGATTDHHDPCTECGGSGKVGGEE